MKLKYYLRGLGVGIICTAILMGIALSGNKKEKLTDTEIIERARLLGMVMAEEAPGADGTDPEGQGEDPNAQDGEGSKDADASGQESIDPGGKDMASGKDPGGKDTASGKDDADSDAPSQDSAGQAKTDSGQSGKKDPSAGQPSSDSAQKGGMVEFEITERDHSEEVSKKLFDAGLISDASKFNQYMIDQKMDDHLQTGKYQIPAGATEDEILEMIVRLP